MSFLSFLPITFLTITTVWSAKTAESTMRASNSNASNSRRSACDRCRDQKLRCLKDYLYDKTVPCRRCLRLGVACITGPSLRPGRPSSGRPLQLGDSRVTPRGKIPPEPAGGFFSHGVAIYPSGSKEFSTQLVETRSAASHGPESGNPSISSVTPNAEAIQCRSSDTGNIHSDISLASFRPFSSSEDFDMRRTDNMGFQSAGLVDAGEFVVSGSVPPAYAPDTETRQVLNCSPQFSRHLSCIEVADYADKTSDPFSGVLDGLLTTDSENWLLDPISSTEEFAFFHNNPQASEEIAGCMHAKSPVRTTDSLIQHLSDINLRMFKQLDQIEDRRSNFSLATLLCVPFHDGNKTSALIEIVVHLSQDFLKLLEIIQPLPHLQSVSPRPVYNTAHQLELPTALIIISCYFQITALYSIIFSQINRSLTEIWPISRPLSLPRLPDINLGPFELPSGNLQSFFMVQLVKHLLSQIERALGPPTQYQLNIEGNKDVDNVDHRSGGLFRGKESYFDLADVVGKGAERRPMVTGLPCPENWKERLESLGLNIRKVETRLRNAV